MLALHLDQQRLLPALDVRVAGPHPVAHRALDLVAEHIVLPLGEPITICIVVLDGGLRGSSIVLGFQ